MRKVLVLHVFAFSPMMRCHTLYTVQKKLPLKRVCRIIWYFQWTAPRFDFAELIYWTLQLAWNPWSYDETLRYTRFHNNCCNSYSLQPLSYTYRNVTESSSFNCSNVTQPFSCNCSKLNFTARDSHWRSTISNKWQWLYSQNFFSMVNTAVVRPVWCGSTQRRGTLWKIQSSPIASFDKFLVEVDSNAVII